MLDKSQLTPAKDQANPYELIKSSIFMNRSAVKLANLDSLFGLISNDRNLLAFTDICGGPGGFTEYITWKCKSLGIKSHGLGITLRGNQDFNLGDVVGSDNGFIQVYGKDGTGDIYSLENIADFCETVLRTGRVNLAVSDGGFSVRGDELNQERHNTQLFIAQILIVLQTLAKGGDSIFKIFDIQLPITVELMYILHLHFERISLLKPFSSRPANSEKYLVCKNLELLGTSEMVLHLQECLREISRLKPGFQPAKSAHLAHQPGFIKQTEKIELGLLEITHVLDPCVLKDDAEFCEMVYNRNNAFYINQRQALDDVYQHATTKCLPFDQLDVMNRCLDQWGLPRQL